MAKSTKYFVSGGFVKCNRSMNPNTIIKMVSSGKSRSGNHLAMTEIDMTNKNFKGNFGYCKMLSRKEKKLVECTCSPLPKWFNVNKKFVDEAGNGCVTMASFIVCWHGGAITPVTDGQDSVSWLEAEIEFISKKANILAMSKTRNERPDSGLSHLPDEEISRRARDKTLAGEERRRYQKEEKLRGNRNKQKRQSNITINIDLDDIGNDVGLSGAALVIYLIISEGSRIVFPPRNLVPIP